MISPLLRNMCFPDATLLPTPKQAPAKKKRKREVKVCQVEGCTNLARSRKLCKKHGGGKRCSVEDCSRAAQCRGLCPKHGGAARCKIQGCMKFSQSHGLCKAHGGGPQCAFE